jgi:hypothetical protein
MNKGAKNGILQQNDIIGPNKEKPTVEKGFHQSQS